MRILSYILALATYIALPLHHASSWFPSQYSILSPTLNLCSNTMPLSHEKHVTAAAVADNENKEDNTDKEKPSDALDNILKQEINKEGVLQNVLGGVALFYKALANILLYPIFSFLLLALSIGAILFAVLWTKKIKKQQAISATWILTTCLYLILYADIFLVVFQRKKILFLFLELEKDMLLVMISGSIGYLIGKFFSNRLLEERRLP